VGLFGGLEMSDNAPERIWAQVDGYDPANDFQDDLLFWQPEQLYDDDQEYVRKDIHDAVVAERDAALARVKALEERVLDLRFCVTQAHLVLTTYSPLRSHLSLTGHSPMRSRVEDAIKKLAEADVRYR